MNVFSNRLKTLRTSKNVTQREVGTALNIAESSYRRYELGKVSPGMEQLTSIADYFDVSIDYLVGRTDNPKINK